MPSDDEKDTHGERLKDREDFLGWKRNMRLLAMRKGDHLGIFDSSLKKMAIRAPMQLCLPLEAAYPG